MKQLIPFIIVIFFSFSSCSKFLDEIPVDRITQENFYKTLADAEGAVSAIYQPIRAVSAFGGQYFLQVELMTEFSVGRGSTAAVGAFQGLDATNAARVSLVWQFLYQGILYANTAIDKITPMENVEATRKAQLIAEAKHMRAFCYYHLVRHWQAVPLLLSSTQPSTGRTPVEEVYKTIIDDLKESETILPETPQQWGRPTKWSTKAFLADVYLTRGEYELAQQEAEDVIASGKFSLVNVSQLQDWDKIFGPTVNGTSEEIFYLKFSHQNGWQWPHNILFSGTPYSPFGNYVMTSSLDNKFLNEWSDNDLRKQWSVFTEYYSASAGQIVPLPGLAPVAFSKFRDPAAPTNAGHANDYTFMRYADILLIQAEASAMAAGSPSSTAIEHLNMIRRRGYGYPVSASSPVDYPSSGWTAETFQDSVLQERSYELFLEGKRWLDLKRTGKVKSSILKYKNINVVDAHMNWPIPQQEIDTNPEIGPEDQNPGY